MNFDYKAKSPEGLFATDVSGCHDIGIISRLATATIFKTSICDKVYEKQCRAFL